MAVEVSTGVFATSQKTCIYTFLMLCEYFFAVLFTFPPFYLPFPSISGEFIVYFVQYFTYFTSFLYCHSSGHVVSECWISFGNIHFFSELIRLCSSTGIVIPCLWFSSILCFTAYFDRIFGAFYESFTRSRDDDVTSKMEVDRSVGRKYSFSQ